MSQNVKNSQQKMLMQQSCYQNDISNEEFDKLFQKYLTQKQVSEEEAPSNYEYEYDYDTENALLEDELTNREIDRILEEAERWADF
jgi:hypothetical protein